MRCRASPGPLAVLTAARDERKTSLALLLRPTRMQNKPSLIAAIAAAIASAAHTKAAHAPGSWRTCQQDEDCSPIITCGFCCAGDAINKQSVQSYQDLYARECRNRRPPRPCVFRKSVCKQGVCELQRQ